jgi:excinuclease ABC subunit C
MNRRRTHLEERLKLVPRKPGVYFLRGQRGELLYVGKAKDLGARLRTYFRPAEPGTRLELLQAAIRDFDYVVTSSETEAFLLEANAVKEHQPPFNIQLKDDKRYPFLRVNVQHRFPGIFVTRRLEQDGSRYFGPYTKVKALRATLKTLRSLFPLRNCTDARLARERRECLEYHMGKCAAPCTGRVDEATYRGIVERLLDVLEGRGQRLEAELRRRMEEAKAAWRFEEAARYRDLLRQMELLSVPQAVLHLEPWDADILGVAVRASRGVAVVLCEREGRVTDRIQTGLTGVEGADPEEVLWAFLTQFYARRPWIPERVVLPWVPRHREAMEAWLRRQAGHRVQVRGPRGDPWRRLAAMAQENAALALEEWETVAERRERRPDPSVLALQEALGLAKAPYVIEGYDVSNIQGTGAVAARVVFRDGRPLKAGYRRYRIRGVVGSDDFAMLSEAVRRRVGRAAQDPLPDLVLVDGGKGQVGAVRRCLEAAGYGNIPVVGLAKRHEEILGPDPHEVRRLPRSSPALKLLQRVRDEAHRFAVSYHRRLRAKSLRSSFLDGIPGIGEARKSALLRAFGSLERLRGATAEEIAKVPGIGRGLAERIRRALDEGDHGGS